MSVEHGSDGGNDGVLVVAQRMAGWWWQKWQLVVDCEHGQ